MASVFIVEDELTLQFLYQMVLSSEGFEIMGTAKNGEEAVEKYKNFPKKPDIVIMDHRMPIKSGLEAAKEILEIDSHTKIIFISADDNMRNIALSMGALSFKNKPFSNEKLINNIYKALNLKNEVVKN